MGSLIDLGLPDRYWSKVDMSDDCWIWTGAKDRKGYGRVGLGGRADGTISAHGWMCAKAHGPKPSDKHMTLHSCNQPSCVNPDHLRWGTAAENSADMVAAGRSARKDTCINGHDLTAEGSRYDYGACKQCARARAAKRSRELRQ